MTGSKTTRRKRRSSWTPCGDSCPVCTPPDKRPEHPDDATPYQEARATSDEDPFDDDPYGDDKWWVRLDNDMALVLAPEPPRFTLEDRLRAQAHKPSGRGVSDRA